MLNLSLIKTTLFLLFSTLFVMLNISKFSKNHLQNVAYPHNFGKHMLYRAPDTFWTPQHKRVVSHYTEKYLIWLSEGP